MTRRTDRAQRVITNGDLEARIEAGVTAALAAAGVGSRHEVFQLKAGAVPPARSADQELLDAVAQACGVMSPDLRCLVDLNAGRSEVRVVERGEHGYVARDIEELAVAGRQGRTRRRPLDGADEARERFVVVHVNRLGIRAERDFQGGHEATTFRVEHGCSRVRRRMRARARLLVSTVGGTTDNRAVSTFPAGLSVRVAAVLRAAAARLDGGGA